MKLTLDYTQRLNLHALMGAQRVNLDDLRLLWKLQDRIDLDAEQRAAINFQIREINGMQQATWDLSKSSFSPAEYEFTTEEFNRIARMVKEWQPGFLTTADRRWLEPLLVQLDNGQPKP